MKPLKGILCALALAVVGIIATFTFGMRTKSPFVLGTIRRFNRAYMNPRQRDAGLPGAYASVIQHTGRTTGTPYETPVVAAETEDGFVIALPYGTQADWLQNVLASGAATIVHEGDVLAVDRPEVLPIDAADAFFSPNDRRAHRLFGVDQCLRVHRVQHDHSTAASM